RSPPAVRASSRIRSDRSSPHPMAHVEHPVASDHQVRILQQVLGVNRPEVRLPAPNTTPAPFMADLVDYHLRQVFAKLEIASEPSSPASNSTHQRARLLFNRKASFQLKNPAFAGLYIGAPG